MLCRYAARFCWESSGSDAGAHDAVATRAIHSSEIAACLAAIVTNGACEGGGKARVHVGTCRCRQLRGANLQIDHPIIIFPL